MLLPWPSGRCGPSLITDGASSLLRVWNSTTWFPTSMLRLSGITERWISLCPCGATFAHVRFAHAIFVCVNRLERRSWGAQLWHHEPICPTKQSSCRLALQAARQLQPLRKDITRELLESLGLAGSFSDSTGVWLITPPTSSASQAAKWFRACPPLLRSATCVAALQVCCRGLVSCGILFEGDLAPEW